MSLTYEITAAYASTMTVVESQLGQLLFTENDIKNLLVLHKQYAKKMGIECFKNGTGELWIKNLVSFSKTYTKKSHRELRKH